VKHAYNTFFENMQLKFISCYWLARVREGGMREGMQGGGVSPSCQKIISIIQQNIKLILNGRG
jgi:hypothetical protein